MAKTKSIEPAACYANGATLPADTIQRLDSLYGRAEAPPDRTARGVYDNAPRAAAVEIKEAAIIRPRSDRELLHVFFDKAWRPACSLKLVKHGPHDLWEGRKFSTEISPSTLAAIEGAHGRWPEEQPYDPQRQAFAPILKCVAPDDAIAATTVVEPLDNLEGALLTVQSGSQVLHVHYRDLWWAVCTFYRAPYRNSASHELPTSPEANSSQADLRARKRELNRKGNDHARARQKAVRQVQGLI